VLTWNRDRTLANDRDHAPNMPSDGVTFARRRRSWIVRPERSQPSKDARFLDHDSGARFACKSPAAEFSPMGAENSGAVSRLAGEFRF
jgi:hypothetical protein